VALFVGPRIELVAVARLVAINIITPLLLAFCSVVFLAIRIVLRERSPRRRAPNLCPARSCWARVTATICIPH